ncbi:hypothetical protein ACFQZX_14135 [Mucilaginibacter litoreus]|uniref:DUF5640 domain-containing protein n=1 Tax=Mucilaginibacter litoreus TaxID=1048221 RepID=A0ABW3AWC0_9SPHI
MKTYALVFIHVIVAAMLVSAACHSNTAGKKVQGTWKSKDGSVVIEITDKHFMMGTDSPIPEDYFVKDDTIFTSFEGNQPYTKFVIKKLKDNSMTLLLPDDTVAVEFHK